jgi:hypothetical protein
MTVSKRETIPLPDPASRKLQSSVGCAVNVCPSCSELVLVNSSPARGMTTNYTHARLLLLYNLSILRFQVLLQVNPFRRSTGIFSCQNWTAQTARVDLTGIGRTVIMSLRSTTTQLEGLNGLQISICIPKHVTGTRIDGEGGRVMKDSSQC